MSITTLVLAALGGLAPVTATAPADAASMRTWEKLAMCESGGRWHLDTGNGYYGGLQFTRSTWNAYGGGRYGATADRASKRHQVRVAERLRRAQGWGAWPVCSRRVGLV